MVGEGPLTSVSVAEIWEAKFTVIMLQPGPSAPTTGRPRQPWTSTGAHEEVFFLNGASSLGFKHDPVEEPVYRRNIHTDSSRPPR